MPTLSFGALEQKRRHNVERILVTYDDPKSQELVGQILEPAGYDVITAAYGPIAMEVFQPHGWRLGYVALQFRTD